MTDRTQHVGVVGLGAIGAPLAESLVHAEVPVVVDDLDVAALVWRPMEGAVRTTAPFVSRETRPGER